MCKSAELKNKMHTIQNEIQLPSGHPDQVYVSLLQQGAIREPVKRRLGVVNEVCRRHYDSGNQDFSWRTLIAELDELGGPSLASGKVFKPPYRELVEAWANFAGGHTCDIKYARKKQHENNTVDYLDRYVQSRNCLPQWAEIINNGVPDHISRSQRPHYINRCVNLWKKKMLADIPLDLIKECERLFALESAVPTVSALMNALKHSDVEISAIDISAYVERWRKCEYWFQTFFFQPTSDKSGFRWLVLHPELAEWRPMVLSFLDQDKSTHTVKASRLALHAFFSNYLLGQSLPLKPSDFLQKGIRRPAFAMSALSHLVYAQQSRRTILVRAFIEHVLSSEQFLRKDEHGYSVRSTAHENPIPWQVDPDTEVSKTIRKRHVPKGALQDPEVSYITDLNPQLERWRVYAAGWLASVTANLSAAQTAVRQVIVGYIVAERLPPDPSTLLSLAWQQDHTLPRYKDTALKGLKNLAEAASKGAEFIDYVLLNNYSAEDDFGRRVVSGDYRNFLHDQVDDMPLRRQFGNKSNKEVLPTIYLRYLRELFCPVGAKNFKDLDWVHNAMPSGDWFEVESRLIDESDPDCVWRRRTLSDGRTIHEMWSPVRSVALIIKLELPLRTFQVRLLDSGEGDTWHYEGGKVEKNSNGGLTYKPGRFIKNKSHLVRDIGRNERHAGLFRRVPDSATGEILTALYINTNKTRDRGKDQWDRGYIVPWQHGKVLYWAERLRDWQQKYNPIDSLMPAADLANKHLGVKSAAQKQLMGSMAFLFRDPTASGQDVARPIADGSLVQLWRKALQKLEDICVEKGHRSADGSQLRFVPESMNPAASATFYPLHSLRVSLITHYATEGGVAMHILSECIAGHARIVMTLYYKKSGVIYVSEAMDAASERLRDETVEQLNWMRWVKEASIRQLEINSASVDASVLNAVEQAIGRGGANLLRTNLGLCAKGGMGCDSGGIYFDDDTGAASFGPVPGYPQQKNCVRCKWFITGPAFLHALVHHWNLLHMNLGDSGGRFLKTMDEIAALEAKILTSQKLNEVFDDEARLADLRHLSSVIYDGNEKLAADSLATMKLIIRCKHIISSSKDPDSGVVLVAVGGMDEVAINVRECTELEQVLTASLGATIYVNEDAHKATLKAGNAYDRMLVMNGKEPIFFKLCDKELANVVAHMTRLLQVQCGGIRQAVPFVEGTEELKKIELFGCTDEILALASAGSPLQLIGRDHRGPVLGAASRETTSLSLAA